MDVPAASLPPGKPISLRTSDGVRLAATYIPPRNGDVVVVLHGSGGDRGGGPISRARMLMRHGFGVLMYDARGSGESSGRPENLGWTWPRDVAAGVDWLKRRPEVRRVGGLGLSTGAEALLDAAAHDRRIDAVVADGAQARQTSELSALPGGPTKVFTGWELLVAQAAYRPLTHAPRPEPLTKLIPRIAPRPVMLISASASFERDMNRGYKREAPSVQLWEPAHTGHTKGLAVHPREYERRVVAFFRAAFRR